jgi:hypothetical protein
MRIIIETILHDGQRYNTCGDWRWSEVNGEPVLNILVSQMRDDEANNAPAMLMEALVGIHELIEAIQCRRDEVTEEQVDRFDLNKELSRECVDIGLEPGDHPLSPYKRQHSLATGVERILCFSLNIPWFEYENQLMELCDDRAKRDEQDNNR